MNEQILTQKVIDKFPGLNLPFMETGGGEFYSVMFSFQEILSIDENKIIFKGRNTISGNTTKDGAIEYDFATQKFYRGSISRNNQFRKITQIEMDPDGMPMFSDLLKLISK